MGLRRLLLTLIAVAMAAIVLSGCAVTPSVPFSRTTFEGFDVISYVPERPRGLVFVFHGTDGSASIAERVEAVDVLNRLVASGYGFVSTSSTERTGERRWDVANAVAHRQSRPGPPAAPPPALGGHDERSGDHPPGGDRHVQRRALRDAVGRDLQGRGLSGEGHLGQPGRIANPVDGPGELTVPTVFSTAENDFTSPPGPIIVNFNDTRQAGTPTELYVRASATSAGRASCESPGIDQDEARQIYFSLVATGVWNGDGERVVANDQEAAARAQAATLPGSVAPQRNEIENQVGITLAVHAFTAEFAPQVETFFNRYVPRQ